MMRIYVVLLQMIDEIVVVCLKPLVSLCTSMSSPLLLFSILHISRLTLLSFHSESFSYMDINYDAEEPNQCCLHCGRHNHVLSSRSRIRCLLLPRKVRAPPSSITNSLLFPLAQEQDESKMYHIQYRKYSMQSMVHKVQYIKYSGKVHYVRCSI